MKHAPPRTLEQKPWIKEDDLLASVSTAAGSSIAVSTTDDTVAVAEPCKVEEWTILDGESVEYPDVGTPGVEQNGHMSLGSMGPPLGDSRACTSPSFLHPFTNASPKHVPSGNGSQTSATVNLLATAMGAGLLSLPKAFAHCGLIPGIGLLLMCAWGADIALQFLVVCSRSSRRNSYEGNAEHFLGTIGRRTINVLLLILLFFAAVAMVVIISQLLPKFFQEISGHSQGLVGDHYIIAALCLVLVFPVCLKEDITILRYTSAIALVNLAYYFVCLNIRFFGRPGGVQIHDGVTLFNFDILEVMQGFSIMVAAYLCHFNIFKIDVELAIPAKPRIWRVIHVAIPGIATTLYIAGGVLGYLFFGNVVSNNMLEQFPGDPLMNIARLALAFTNLFKLPLIVQPLRESIFEALPTGLPKYNVSATVILLSVVYAAAMALGSLSRTLGILGCTTGIAIAFILPGLLRLRHSAGISQTSKHEARARFGAKTLVVCGIVFSCGAMVGNVVYWNST